MKALAALALAALLAGPAAAQGTSPSIDAPDREAGEVPARAVAVVKGVNQEGAAFARLAVYGFAPDGRVRQSFWYWQNTDRPQRRYRLLGRPIGVADQPGYRESPDRERSVAALGNFLEGEPLGLAGRWRLEGGTLRIDWGEAGSEAWRLDPSDPSLPRMELLGASYLAGPAAAAAGPEAPNVGWAFGSEASGPPAPGEMRRDFRGRIAGYNALTCRHGPVQPEGLALGSRFRRTDTGVYRYVSWDDRPGGRHWVFSYLAPVRPGSARDPRIALQVSHDFNNDGAIEDNVGHVYSGLPIVDRRGSLRGFVFAEASPAASTCQPHGTSVAALVYLAD